MATGTILWHDYETSGTDPARDRPMQFAAVRTDLELEERGEPSVLFAKLSEDVLPEPEACLVHRLTPSRIAADAVDEPELAREVLGLMTREDATCCAGYNSLRFDDEVTRFTLWRNLLPVYDREWRDGNTRWDLIDPLRAARALRPDGIEWPLREDGHPSFRLEDLARANDIPHVAHDALGDVRATIALARRLRAAQPKLFEWSFEGRTKAAAAERMRGFGDSPFVHTSGRIAAELGCTSVFVQVGEHPRIRSQLLCVDLRHDPAVLLDEPPERLRELAFTRRDELPEDAPRVPFKGVRLNRAPVVAPLDVLDEAAWERIGLEPGVVEAHATFVAQHRRAVRRALVALHEDEPAADEDVETSLYGGFLDDADMARCARVHEATPAGWRALERRFADPRLGELLFRLRARWHPETLDDGERARWRAHCAGRLAGAGEIAERAAALRREHAGDPDAVAILEKVETLARGCPRRESDG